ncbi:hypothetical protein GGS21DRAFT_140869 [Xylaria nigripes]|nr:hypothetical protein GGS21DRAFT_140869 [Xylaria nigripes]
MPGTVIPPGEDPIDDIFGSDSESPVDGAEYNAHPDISLDARRLQAQHNTVGYRQGITDGKAATIQAGFDDGFALGAHIGVKAGQILGVLESIGIAVAEIGLGDEAARVFNILSEAAAELNPKGLFTSDFWAPDGAWTYAVMTSDNEDKITHQEVAEQHPLIIKWSRIANREADKWGVDLSLPIFTSNEAPAQEDAAASNASPRPDSTPRDAIDW